MLANNGSQQYRSSNTNKHIQVVDLLPQAHTDEQRAKMPPAYCRSCYSEKGRHGAKSTPTGSVQDFLCLLVHSLVLLVTSATQETTSSDIMAQRPRSPEKKPVRVWVDGCFDVCIAPASAYHTTLVA